MRANCKCIGITVAAFGLGIMTAFFMPSPALIVIEAGVIIATGFLFIKT